MRRFYAFEAEELSPAIQKQLEQVEDTVEEKCTTPAACDKVLDKIEKQEDKYNGALQAMADAAKDCQDGKCEKADMAKVVDEKMGDLKQVAKDIGVASEGDVPSEEELKDVKHYLEGAKEIVEAKKDELDGGEGHEEPDGDEGCGENCGDGDGDEGAASESMLTGFIGACESMMIDTSARSQRKSTNVPFLFD